MITRRPLHSALRLPASGLILTALSLLASALILNAGWSPVAIDRTAGAAAPQTLTRHSLPAVTNGPVRVATNIVAAQALLIRSVSAGPVFPSVAASIVTVTAVTSGVAVTVGTFTNAAAPALAEALWLAPGDLVTATSTNATNSVAISYVLQPALPAAIAPDPAPDAIRITSVRLLTADTAIPAGSAVTLTLTPYGGTASNLATLTTAPFIPADPLLLLPGDIIDATPARATNSVRIRAHAERFTP